MIIARFLSSTGLLIGDSPLISANFSRSLNASGEWQISLPAALPVADQLTLNAVAVLYYKGARLIGGPIQAISQAFDDSPTLEISGRDEFDSLYSVAADSIAYYDDRNILAGLYALLFRANWRIGKVDTYQAPTATVTIDLRNEKNVLTQIASLVKDQPGVVYRYGGYEDGYHLLDIGTLAYPVRRTLSQPAGLDYVRDQDPSVPILTALTVKTTIIDRIDVIEAIGGDVQDTSGVKRTITLGDAIDVDPTRRYDANYPIVETVSEQAFSILRRAAGRPGGRVVSNPITTLTVAIIGEIGAVNSNYHTLFTFQPMPGVLKAFNFWSGTVSGAVETNLKALTFMWYLHAVDEVNPHIPGTLLQSGIIPNSAWGSNRHCRVKIDNGYTLEYGVRYQIRVGFTTIPAANNNITVQYANVVPLSKSARMDYSTAIAAGYVSYNRYPKFVVETEATDEFVGGSIVERNTAFAPQRTSGNVTLAEIQNTANALYTWGKQYLDTHLQNRSEYTAQISGGLFDIEPGDALRLLAKAEYVTEDRFANTLSRRFEQVDITLRVQSIKYQFQDGKVQGSVTFMDQNLPAESANTEINQFDTQEKKKPEGKIIPLPDQWSMTSVTFPVSAVLPNTVMSGSGLPARLVQVGTSAPAGIADMVLIAKPFVIHNSGLDMELEIAFEPDYPNGIIGAGVRIAVKNRGWTYDDSAVITMYFGWR